MNNVRFVGLDVHAKTIAAAVAEVNGEVRSLGIIPNRPESLQWRAAAATRRTSAPSSPAERCRDSAGAVASKGDASPVRGGIEPTPVSAQGPRFGVLISGMSRQLGQSARGAAVQGSGCRPHAVDGAWSGGSLTCPVGVGTASLWGAALT